MLGRIFLGKPSHWLALLLGAGGLYWLGFEKLHVRDFNLYTAGIAGIAIFLIGLVWFILSIWTPLTAFLERNKDPDQPSFLNDVLPILCFALFLTVPIAALGVLQWVEESQAANWIETPATVIESSLRYTDEWTPNVLYEWRDESGVPHRSRRITFAMFYGSVTRLENFLKGYPPGAEVSCYVDPDNSNRAVLLRKHRPGYTGVLAYGMVVILCWVVVFRHWHAWRKGLPAPGIDYRRWLNWKSPIVLGAAAFLLEATRPVVRELQLGEFWTDTQKFATVALLIVLASAALAAAPLLGRIYAKQIRDRGD